MCKSAYIFVGVLIFYLSLVDLITSEDIDDHFNPHIFEIEEEEDEGSVRSRKNADDAAYIIPDNYSIYESPPSYGKPIYVEASIVIFNVRDINELNQDYNLEINLRLYWRDERLTPLELKDGKPYMILNQKLLNKIWTPDVFIDNVKNISQPILISRPSSLRIYDDSTIRYSTRMTINMACRMNFFYYPADTQICNVDFRSYAFDVKDLTLGWRDGLETKILTNFHLQSYHIGIHEIHSFTHQTRNNRTYWVLRLAIRIQRKMYFHMLQTYCPSILFVIISWLSFWVPPDTVSARMTLCITTLLTLGTMFAAVRQSSPNESYAKGLDIWMLACIIFVFATLVEYSVILKLRSKKPKEKIEPPIDSQHEGRHIKWRSLFDKLSSTMTLDSEDEPKVTTISYLSWYQNDCQEFVPYHIRRPKLRNSLDSSPMTDSTPTNTSSSSSPAPSVSQSPILAKNKEPQKESEVENKYKRLAEYIDKISSLIIPGSFVLFNIVYWPWLIVSSNYNAYPTS